MAKPSPADKMKAELAARTGLATLVLSGGASSPVPEEAPAPPPTSKRKRQRAAPRPAPSPAPAPAPAEHERTVAASWQVLPWQVAQLRLEAVARCNARGRGRPDVSALVREILTAWLEQTEKQRGAA